jgi:hypothetical protein
MIIVLIFYFFFLIKKKKLWSYDLIILCSIVFMSFAYMIDDVHVQNDNTVNCWEKKIPIEYI